MNIAEVVSGRAKLKGIRRALLSVAARNLLADQLRALLPAEAVVGPLRIREAQFKPGRKLTAYYDAAVYAEGKKAACVRPIAVTWESETGADRSGEMVDITKAVAEAVRRGVADRKSTRLNSSHVK